jgi:hypothetical protein
MAAWHIYYTLAERYAMSVKQRGGGTTPFFPPPS